MQENTVGKHPNQQPQRRNYQEERFPALLDASGRVNGIYGVRSIPTSYLLDRQGRVVSREIGARNWANAEARALIASLVNEPDQVPEDHAARPPHPQ
jgi:hypothetical protein